MNAEDRAALKPRRAAPDPTGKRVVVNTKVTQSLRDRMEASASASGRTLSHEIERLLERGLMADDLMRVARETIRDEMRAEFQARRPQATPHSDVVDRRLLAKMQDEICGPTAYHRANGIKAD